MDKWKNRSATKRSNNGYAIFGRYDGLSVEAGLDFAAAITKVVEKAKKSPLNDELMTFLKEIKVGAKSRGTTKFGMEN